MTPRRACTVLLALVGVLLQGAALPSARAAGLGHVPTQEHDARACVRFLRGPAYAGTQLKNACNTFIHVQYCYEPNRNHRCDRNGGIWDSRELGPQAVVQVAYVDSIPYYGFACHLPHRARLARGPRGAMTALHCEEASPRPRRPPRASPTRASRQTPPSCSDQIDS